MTSTWNVRQSIAQADFFTAFPAFPDVSQHFMRCEASIFPPSERSAEWPLAECAIAEGATRVDSCMPVNAAAVWTPVNTIISSATNQLRMDSE